MDEHLRRNLDTESRRLDEIETTLRGLLDGDLPECPPPTSAPAAPLTYAELTAENDRLRAERDWYEVDLDVALNAEHRAAFERWRTTTRIAWSDSDLAAVGAAALVGAAATWADTQIDRSVLNGLEKLRKTGLLRRWEAAGKRLPIDYMGTGFGGKAHRVRSPGHDLLRLVEATRQILDAEFRGVRWLDGVKEPVTEPGQGRFRGDLNTVADALTALLKHLAADFVTPMGLPMPGASLLYEVDNRTVRKIIHQAYLGTSDGNGLNLRSGVISAGLPGIATEVVIRLHIHAEARNRFSSDGLDAARDALRSELLLAGHTLVATTSIGKAIARACGLEGDKKFSAVRHINVPVLLAVASYAGAVIGDVLHRRAATGPSWEELAATVEQSWSPELDLLLVSDPAHGHERDARAVTLIERIGFRWMSAEDYDEREPS